MRIFFNKLISLTSQLENQNPASQLITVGEHNKYVMLKDIRLLGRHQSIV